MAVNISGTVLASLFYDQSRSIGDQTGFLIGEVVKHVKDTISDSQINNVEVETKVYIYETVPCPRDQKFFTSAGQIKTKAVADLLKNGEKTIVGWYSFRRNSPLRPSYRERMLYQNLADCVAEDRNLFTLLLCSGKSSANKSTHTLDYSFLRLIDNVFKRMAVNIANLGDTTHTEYKHMPSLTASKSQGLCSHLVHQHEEDFLNQHGQMEVRKIQSLNGSFSRKLEEISQAVIESESRLAEVEDEVIKYRKQVRWKQLEKEQELRKLNKAETANTSGTTLKDIEKKPSVDDILFMDQLDSDPNGILPTPPAYETATKPQGSGEDSVPDRETDSTLQNSASVSSSTPQIKLTPGATLHNRSSSMGEEKDFPAKGGISPIHTRSKSNDSTTNSSKQSNDPFSFITSVVAESKSVKSDSSVSSPAYTSEETDGSGNVKDSRIRQKVSTKGAMAAAKSFGKSQSKGERSQKSEGQKSKSQHNTSDNNAMDVDHDMSDSLRNKSSVPQQSAKKCSQEADGLEDTASSQDTYEMDITSSPVY